MATGKRQSLVTTAIAIAPYLYMAAHRALTAWNMPPLALRAEYR